MRLLKCFMKKQKSEYSLDPSFGFVKKLARNIVKKSKIKKYPIILRDIFNCLGNKILIKGLDLGSEDGFSVGTSLINYNKTHSVVRQRFTVAHELGHILLGHNSRSRVIDFNSKDINEQQANVFASELLVPLQMIKETCSSSESLSSLADKFWVSKDMMQWRLSSCRLDSKIRSWE